MNQANINHYDALPTRERMKPRNATKQTARTTAHWEDKKRKKKVDRCEKISYYLEQ